MAVSMIEIIWGLILSGMGGVTLIAAIRRARRPTIAVGLSAIPFALFFVAFGICHVAKGLGHPLMSKETNGVVFIISGLVCLAFTLIFGLIEWLRSRKRAGISLRSTLR
jgi:hypothetical protein